MKIKLLDQRHPTYDGPELARCRALYSGGKAWHALREHWLPMLPEEESAAYAARLSRALYTNHAGPICDVLASAVFAEAPAVEGASWASDFASDVDREGSTLQQWARDRLSDALVERTAWAWVNLPARPLGTAVASRADEEAAGLLRAYLVPLRAEQVIDWEVDDDGRLAWVMVRDVLERRLSVDRPRTQVHRWTLIDRATIRRWTWSHPERSPGPEDEADEGEAVAHGFGELPVARLQLVQGLHAMGKLHDPAVAHLRARNDLSWALHRAAHALLWISAKWQDQRPVLGPGRYLRLGLEDKIGYAEPSGQNFQLLAEDLVQLREELYRVVQQMALGADSDASRSKASGESKALDWRAMEIVLSALAESTKQFLADVLRLVARARGETAAPSVSGLDGWQQEDLEVWLAAAAASTDAHALSPTFRREVAKRQAARVLQDADATVLKTVQDEIDAAEVDDPAPYVPPDRRQAGEPDLADEPEPETP